MARGFWMPFYRSAAKRARLVATRLSNFGLICVLSDAILAVGIVAVRKGASNIRTEFNNNGCSANRTVKRSFLFAHSKSPWRVAAAQFLRATRKLAGWRKWEQAMRGLRPRQFFERGQVQQNGKRHEKNGDHHQRERTNQFTRVVKGESLQP